MKDKIIKFLHLSDSHFGAHFPVRTSIRTNRLRKQYGERFFSVVKQILQKEVTEGDIDFVIHTGDFFNRSKPPPVIVDKALTPFSHIAQKIPIYFVPGNHERGKLPFGLINFQENIKIFQKPRSFILEKSNLKIKISGIPYIRHNANSQFWKSLDELIKSDREQRGKDFDFSILAIHQLISGSKIENYTFKNSLNTLNFQKALLNFDYIACGHVHRFQFLYPNYRKENQPFNSISNLFGIFQDLKTQKWVFNSPLKLKSNQTFSQPVIAYAGATERVSLVERNEAKGYITVTINVNNSDHNTNLIQYTFHPIDAIPMDYFIWNLESKSVNQYINEFIRSTKLPKKQNQDHYTLRRVSRVKLIGIISEKESQLIKKFKNEIKDRGCYLTITQERIAD